MDSTNTPLSVMDVAGVFENVVSNDLQFLRNRLRFGYDAHKEKWLAWDGGLWQEATGMMNAVSQIIARLCSDKKVAKWQKPSVYRDVLTLAKETLTLQNLDGNAGLIGLPNGDVWDLERGEGWPNLNALPVTKSAGAPTPDTIPDKRFCPIGQANKPCVCHWHCFLRDATGDDAEMVDNLQMAVGASMFGDNRDNLVHVLVGDGGTGKSVFLNAIAAALGDYAASADARVFSGRNDEHPAALASIATSRFVQVPELASGSWREGTLKAISGGDTLSVRWMRGNPYQVKPQCTLWIASNEPPALRVVDNAMKRRIRIWPFVNAPEEPDPTLPARLQAESMRSLVLQWVLEGATKYAALGDMLPMCDAVQDATAEYFDTVDTIGAWMQAVTKRSAIPEYDSTAKELYASYTTWCEGEGYKAIARRSWGISMTRRVDNRKGMKGKLYAIYVEDEQAVN